MDKFKIILKIFLFTYIFIMILVFIGNILNYNDLYQYDPKQRVSNNSIDGAIFGSSVIECSLLYLDIYHNTDIKLLPEATSSERLNVTYYKIKELFKTQSPKVIIVDLYLTVGDKQYIPSDHFSFDNMKFGISKVLAASTIRSDINGKINLIFPAFDYHTNWKRLARMENKKNGNNYEEKEDFLLENTDIYKIVKPEDGHIYSEFLRFKDSKYYSLKIGDYIYTYVEKYVSKYALKIVELARKHNTQVIFTCIPKLSNDFEIDQIVALKEYYQDDKDVHIINFYELIDEIGLNSHDDMFDNVHLNYLGAQKITKYMIEYLENNFEFEKNDIDRELWDKTYLKYVDKMRYKLNYYYENDIGNFDEVFKEYY